MDEGAARQIAHLLEAEKQARQRLETLQAANAAVSQSLDLDTVLESLLDYLAELIPYDSANVMLRTDDATVAVRATRGYDQWTDPAQTRRITFDVHTTPPIRQMFEDRQSLLVPDTAQYPGWKYPPGAEHVRSWLAVPLVATGRIVGLFSVDKVEAGFFSQEHVRLAEALAPQAAVAIQNARLYGEVKAGREQLRGLSRRLVEVQEQERRALSRDLHDTSGQNITALKLGLGSLKRSEGCSESVCARLDELIGLADTVSEDLHRLAVNLRPSSLDRYGLVPALEQLLGEFHRQTGLDVRFAAPGMRGPSARLPGDVETALYRIVQESLTNAARYAQADGVSVLLQQSGGGAEIIVEDDGRGFDVGEAQRSGRLGLLGMRERAEMLGGTLEIESSPGRGTTIYAIVPAGEERAEAASGAGEQPADLRPVTSAPAAKRDAAESHLAGAAGPAHARALYDGAGAITGYGTVNRDMTGRVAAEEAIEVHREHLEILHEIDRSILAARTPAETAQAAIEKVLRVMSAIRVAVALYDSDADEAGILAVAGLDSPELAAGSRWPLSTSWLIDEVRAGRVAVITDVADLPDSDPFRVARLAQGIRSVTMVPLIVGSEVIGQLTIQRREPGSLSPDLVDLATHLADSLAIAIDNARTNQALQDSRAQLQAYSHRLIEAAEQERRAVARELHDQANQLLTSLMLGLSLLAKRYPRSDEAGRQIAYLRDIGDDLSKCMHDLAVSLRPASLDRIGLAPALRQLTEMFRSRAGLQIELVTVGLHERLGADIETAAYRIVEEALNNIMQHARATNAGVVVQRHEDRIVIIVEDNGTGFDVEAAFRSGRLGLLGMRERAEMVNGTLTIETKPGGGTALFVELPCAALR